MTKHMEDMHNRMEEQFSHDFAPNSKPMVAKEENKAPIEGQAK